MWGDPGTRLGGVVAALVIAWPGTGALSGGAQGGGGVSG